MDNLSQIGKSTNNWNPYVVGAERPSRGLFGRSTWRVDTVNPEVARRYEDWVVLSSFYWTLNDDGLARIVYMPAWMRPG